MSDDDTSLAGEEWSVADLAYFAGIIDGEGTICIARGFDKRREGKVYFIPHLKVCNTDKALITWMHKKFGGRINNVRYANEKWNTLFSIRWNIKKAEKVLKAVYPYLRVKKLQATVLLEMLNRMHGRNIGFTLSQHECDMRALLYDLMRKLNERGPHRAEVERLSEEATQVFGLVRQSELAGNEPQETGGNVQSA